MTNSPLVSQPIPAAVRDLARRVAEVVREEAGPRTRCLWFGSWVTGTAVLRSDVDIAFEADAPLSPHVRRRTQDRVDGLPTLRAIDLVDLHVASERLRRRILEEGVPL